MSITSLPCRSSPAASEVSALAHRQRGGRHGPSVAQVAYRTRNSRLLSPRYAPGAPAPIDTETHSVTRWKSRPSPAVRRSTPSNQRPAIPAPLVRALSTP
eukprot:scaffold5178_cov364-Prasinococcus_capsulatus_cf.AAC.5